MKDILQQKVDELSDICLANAEVHNRYTDDDLTNATVVFSHFLMDVIYTENQHLPKEKQLELAETTGKAIRELIRSATGKDMHELAKYGN